MAYRDHAFNPSWRRQAWPTTSNLGMTHELEEGFPVIYGHFTAPNIRVPNLVQQRAPYAMLGDIRHSTPYLAIDDQSNLIRRWCSTPCRSGMGIPTPRQPCPIVHETIFPPLEAQLESPTLIGEPIRHNVSDTRSTLRPSPSLPSPNPDIPMIQKAHCRCTFSHTPSKPVNDTTIALPIHTGKGGGEDEDEDAGVLHRTGNCNVLRAGSATHSVTFVNNDRPLSSLSSSSTVVSTPEPSGSRSQPAACAELPHRSYTEDAGLADGLRVRLNTSFRLSRDRSVNSSPRLRACSMSEETLSSRVRQRQKHVIRVVVGSKVGNNRTSEEPNVLPSTGSTSVIYIPLTPSRRDQSFDSERHGRHFVVPAIESSFPGEPVNEYGPSPNSIIPQQRYRGGNQRSFRKPVPSRRVEFHCKNGLGVRLSLALCGDLQSLKDPNEEITLEGRGEKISYRIHWPGGYQRFDKSKHLGFGSCRRAEKIRTISRVRVLQHVAEITSSFIQANLSLNPADQRWKVGTTAGTIRLENLVLVAVEQVSGGSLQPEFKFVEIP